LREVTCTELVLQHIVTVIIGLLGLIFKLTFSIGVCARKTHSMYQVRYYPGLPASAQG